MHQISFSRIDFLWSALFCRGLVGSAVVKATQATTLRPVNKLILILPNEEQEGVVMSTKLRLAPRVAKDLFWSMFISFSCALRSLKKQIAVSYVAIELNLIH